MRRLEPGWEAEMVESINAVGAAEGGESGGGEPAAQDLGCSFADPFKARLAAVVVEGEHEKDAAAPGAGVSGQGIGLKSRTMRWNHEQRKRNQPPDKAESMRKVNGHDRVIIGVSGVEGLEAGLRQEHGTLLRWFWVIGHRQQPVPC